MYIYLVRNPSFLFRVNYTNLDIGIIMGIPTEMELVWKPKLITRLIGGMAGYMCLGYGYENMKIDRLTTQWNPPMRYRNQTRHPKDKS